MDADYADGVSEVNFLSNPSQVAQSAKSAFYFFCSFEKELDVGGADGKFVSLSSSNPCNPGNLRSISFEKEPDVGGADRKFVSLSSSNPRNPRNLCNPRPMLLKL